MEKERFETQEQMLSKIEELERENDRLVKQNQKLNSTVARQSSRISSLSRDVNQITKSTSWRITKPMRALSSLWLLILRAFAFLRVNGLKATLRRIKNRRLSTVASNLGKLQEIANRYYISEADRKKQEKQSFPRNIKFSVLVPLYNTSDKFLREMIESVQNQTYFNWELCLADGSDDEHTEVGSTVSEYVKKDARIKYKKLEKNLGISENTNACIEMATGDYIALFDHDDLLHPSALYEVMCAICEQDADYVYTDEITFSNEPSDGSNPHFKPDYSPDTLRSYNYICHFSVFSRELLDKVGYFNSEFDGSQDYDLILRLTEKAKKVVHIPKTLYYWRAHQNSVAQDIGAKPYTLDAAKRALSAHLERLGLKGEVTDSVMPTTYRIKYEIENNPLVSILIPNYNHIDELKVCLDSIREKSTYGNYEIIIIENNSDEETFKYYDSLKSDERIKVVVYHPEGGFNYSAINNFGAKYAKGDYLLLLNNDIEILTPSWIEEMLMFCQRKDVGAVGAKLYYPDDTIQHAGVIIGLGGVAGHSHKYFPREHCGYAYRLTIAQNMSCCTAACLLVKKSVFDEVGGFDEKFAVAFNDVDLCMKIRDKDYLIVFTPYAEMYHYESKSRGNEDTPEKIARFNGEIRRFKSKWSKQLLAGDPYYNVNLTLDREDFSFA